MLDVELKWSGWNWGVLGWLWVFPLLFGTKRPEITILSAVQCHVSLHTKFLCNILIALIYKSGTLLTNALVNR